MYYTRYLNSEVDGSETSEVVLIDRQNPFPTSNKLCKAHLCFCVEGNLTFSPSNTLPACSRTQHLHWCYWCLKISQGFLGLTPGSSSRQQCSEGQRYAAVQIWLSLAVTFLFSEELCPSSRGGLLCMSVIYSSLHGSLRGTCWCLAGRCPYGADVVV